jgi:hypothetical protein
MTTAMSWMMAAPRLSSGGVTACNDDSPLSTAGLLPKSLQKLQKVAQIC